ncbi:MAG: sigma-70 family RNA polymerase sigma factor [Cyanothece sp. SIO2G6]|nr:sigma-70 family RNA polymerase sigma factor [Cyanothece sp. SIO2G6]
MQTDVKPPQIGRPSQNSAAPSAQPLFWSIWAHYEHHLWQRCYYRMNCNVHDAEDALSQAKIKALEKWPTASQTVRNPKAWLITLTDRLCIDLIRKSGYQATSSTDQIERYDSDFSDISSVSMNPEYRLLNHELRQILCTEIQNLPASLQEVFSAYYLHQKTTRDIARQLAINENTIYKRLQKAREYLKSRLTSYLHSHDYDPKPLLSPLNSAEAIPSQSQNPIKRTFAITALCLELQPQLWSLSNIQLGWN